MAITFSKTISETEILNAYNDNVVEFKSDSAQAAVKCTINIGGNDLLTFPIVDVFTYNFKEIVSILINQNLFSDSILPNANNVNDSTLKGIWLVTFTITLADDSTDITTKTYYFIKSVEQIARTSNKLLSEQHFLNPLNLTMFKGFPFDVTRFSNGNTTLSNANPSVTGTVALTSVDNDTERLWLSRGDSLMQAVTPVQDFIVEGFNAITASGPPAITMNITMKDIECGVYLKWFIEGSGWNYWLFNHIHKTNLQSKSLGSIKSGFESIDNTFFSKVSLGKTGKLTKLLIADTLTENELMQLQDILTSPRVELYNGEYNDAVTNASWQSIEVLDGTFNIEDTKKVGGELRIAIEVNKYTQI